MTERTTTPRTAGTERFGGTPIVPIALGGVGLGFAAMSAAAWTRADFAFDDPVLRIAGSVIAALCLVGFFSWRGRDRLTVGPRGIGGDLLGEPIPWDRISAVSARLVLPRLEDETTQSHWMLRLRGPGLDREISLVTLRGRALVGRNGEAAVASIERFRPVDRDAPAGAP